MAMSASKSSSKRGSLTASSATSASLSGKESKTAVDPHIKVPSRRSRSVSAFSRTRESEVPDFSNSRDNPLFWNNISTSLNEDSPKFHDNSTNIGGTDAKSTTNGGMDNQRGRSVARNADSGSKVSENRSSFGRSLSRTNRGTRERSVSRPPVSRPHYVNSESEAEQDIGSTTISRRSSKPNSAAIYGKNYDLARRSSAMSDDMKDRRTWSSQHSPFIAKDNFSASSIRNHESSQKMNLEDGASSSSCLAGVEEKTINAVCVQMKSAQGGCLQGDTRDSIYETIQTEIRRAISDIQNDLSSVIQRNNATAFSGTDVPDIPSDLVNPGSVDLVMNMREECAKKLEQSQDRARKLRAELAAEEYRGQELSRIIREILPDQNASNAQKCRLGRKSSIERRKMSKRLTDEAMTYFDECVSLSTFDSSDFSSQDEQPFNRAFVTSPLGNRSSLLQEPDTRTTSVTGHDYLGQNSKVPAQNEGSQSSSNLSDGRKFQFCLASDSAETLGIHEEFGKYVKKFEKDGLKSRTVRSKHYNNNEFNLQEPPESLLLDKFLFRKRIDSGGLVLCGVSLSVLPSPFDPTF